MSELRRFLEGEGTSEELVLLQAALRDRPESHAARIKTLAALGVGTAAAGTAAAGAASVAAGTAVKTATALNKVIVVTFLKWFGMSALATATVLGSVEVASSLGWFASEPAPAYPASTSPRPAASSPLVASTHENHLGQTPVDTVATSSATPSPVLPAESTPALARAAAGPSSNLASSAKSSQVAELMAQVAHLDRARAALSRGDTGGCRGQIQSFRRQFPAGALMPESTVLEVQLLLGEGNQPAAAALARRYTEANPSSPYAKRILQLVSPEVIDSEPGGQ